MGPPGFPNQKSVCASPAIHEIAMTLRFPRFPTLHKRKKTSLRWTVKCSFIFYPHWNQLCHTILMLLLLTVDKNSYAPVTVRDHKLSALPAVPDLFDITGSSVEIQAMVKKYWVSISNVEIIREVGRGMIFTWQRYDIYFSDLVYIANGLTNSGDDLAKKMCVNLKGCGIISMWKHLFWMWLKNVHFYHWKFWQSPGIKTD